MPHRIRTKKQAAAARYTAQTRINRRKRDRRELERLVTLRNWKPGEPFPGGDVAHIAAILSSSPFPGSVQGIVSDVLREAEALGWTPPKADQ